MKSRLSRGFGQTGSVTDETGPDTTALPGARQGAGRPRDPLVEQRVLGAARELLAEVGYEGTTIQGISKRSGVSAPTIYRRWATKPAIVEDAVFHLDEFSLPTPTGDVRDDLRAWARMFLDMAIEPASRAAVPALMSAYSRDPESYNRLLERGETPARVAIAAMLEADHASCDADMVFDLLRGAIFMRAQTHGGSGADAFCDRLTDALSAVISAGGDS